MSTIGKSFIERNKFGVWQVNYYCKVKKRGLVTSLFTKDEKEANKKYDIWKAEHILGIVKEVKVTGTPFMEDAFKDFRSSLVNKRKKYSTIKAHQTALDFLLRTHGNKPVDQYGLIDTVQNLNVVEGEHAWNTAANYAKHLHQQFEFYLTRPSVYAVKENPILPVSKEDTDPVSIPPDVLQIIYDALKEKDPHYYYCVKLAKLNAYRRGELVNVMGEDFNFEDGTIQIWNIKESTLDKKRIDVIPMLSDTEDFLRNEYFKEGKFFRFTTGGSIYSFWRDTLLELEAQKKIPRRYSFHSLRKTRSTELYALGMSDFDVQNFMRHKSFATTLGNYVNGQAKQDRVYNDVLSARDRMNRVLKSNPLQVFQIAK